MFFPPRSPPKNRKRVANVFSSKTDSKRYPNPIRTRRQPSRGAHQTPDQTVSQCSVLKTYVCDPRSPKASLSSQQAKGKLGRGTIRRRASEKADGELYQNSLPRIPPPSSLSFTAHGIPRIPRASHSVESLRRGGLPANCRHLQTAEIADKTTPRDGISGRDGFARSIYMRVWITRLLPIGS